MKRVCVFCGSGVGARPAYADGAKALVHAMHERSLGLVYGGGDVGLMGVIADEMLGQGGEVIGVIPHTLVDKEVAHRGLTKLEVVQTMGERKRILGEQSDGFVTLPGGHGTLDELFEVICEVQLGFHAKPIGVLNVDGFYDPLIAFLDRLVEEQFVQPQHRGMLIIDRDPGVLLDRMLAYEPSGALEKYKKESAK